jgi:LacI family transcriptional regulator
MVMATKMPVVDMGGNPEYGIGNIDSDDAMMSRMAVEHFLDLGLRHFAFFTYAAAWWIDTHRRFFCDILDEYGFECHVYSAPPSSHPTKIIWNESERKPIIEWLGSLPRPIGIYTPGDWIAVRLLEICRENGIAVPEEVAILGLENDVTVCESVKPTLSSIELDMQCLGYEAARLLDRLMNGEKIPKEPLIVPPSGVIARQSTAIMLLEDDVLHALRYIRENACHGIDVDQVAKAMGLSRSALHRRFLSQLKRTAKSEIMRVRIERARELLKQSEKISESLARKCGFASLRYFTLAFSREVGITPAAYRRVRQHSPVSGEAKAF